VDALQSTIDLARVDLVVSAVGVPAVSQVQAIRERSNVLLVALLPEDTSGSDAWEVMDLGADDAIVKPFDPRHLLAKVRALLRRRTDVDHGHAVLRFDGLEIDVRSREVKVGGRLVDLPAREFDLLVFLASSPRQVFSRTQIMAAVWSIDDGMGTATVTEHVRRLRCRLEADRTRPRWIQTVWSVGYRFTP
jgi:DNA-binding response OmpR family regulator